VNYWIAFQGLPQYAGIDQHHNFSFRTGLLVYILLSLGVFGFLGSLIFTPVIRDAFARLGIVDRPDHTRKLHTRPVPRLGGLAILMAYVLAYGATSLGFMSVDLLLPRDLHLTLGIGIGVLIVFFIGLADDFFELRPLHKLLAQIVAAGFAYWGGVQIHFRGLPEVGWLSCPLTLLWLIGCTNAFNLIDGMDGLAAGVGLFATITTLIAALTWQNLGMVMATMPLAACLLGFLRYNFNPASVFLGDCGSLSIGFFLGCCGAIWSQKAATLLGMTAPLMAFAIPLLDAALAIVRRFLRRQPIFGADRRHIHHLLLDRGLTTRRVVILMYGICTVAAIFSLVQNSISDHLGGFVVILFCVAAWIGIQHLGYSEFGLATRLLLRGSFRHLIDAQFRLEQFREKLAGANTLEQCWKIVQAGAHEFGFAGVRLCVESEVFENRTSREEVRKCFQMRIPLSDGEYVNLQRGFDATADLSMTAGFAHVLQDVLSNRSWSRTQVPAVSVPQGKIYPSVTELDGTSVAVQ
jgi:UDP-GlcNAc:undecaprenyl-phosphate/decaprenyl-phosphate GlcNAc-1-phosphate transferase